MKYIVIAHHHGAFLTIKQLRELKQEFIVLVPQSQVDKYTKMGEDVFVNFLPNIKKAAGKKTPVYTVDMQGGFLPTLATWMAELKCEGNWTVVQAGTLILSSDSHISLNTQFGLVKARVHPKFKKLYKMLGREEVDDSMYLHTVFVNMNKRDGRVTEVPSDAVMRPDILYKMSFGALWCIRHRQMVNHSALANFWMEAIRADQENGEWLAYPYHLYAEYAKKVKALLPEASFNNIIENGERSASVQDLVELDL